MHGQRHAPAALPPGKRPGTHCIGGWVGPRAGLEGCGKCRLHRFFFFWFLKSFCCSLFLTFAVLVFFVLNVLAGSFVFTVQNTIQTSMSPAGFEPAISGSERIRFPDRLARSVSLYRLSYPGRQKKILL